jgi:hypothetical protein
MCQAIFSKEKPLPKNEGHDANLDKHRHLQPQPGVVNLPIISDSRRYGRQT